MLEALASLPLLREVCSMLNSKLASASKPASVVAPPKLMPPPSWMTDAVMALPDSLVANSLMAALVSASNSRLPPISALVAPLDAPSISRPSKWSRSEVADASPLWLLLV